MRTGGGDEDVVEFESEQGLWKFAEPQLQEAGYSVHVLYDTQIRNLPCNL